MNREHGRLLGSGMALGLLYACGMHAPEDNGTAVTGEGLGSSCASCVDIEGESATLTSPMAIVTDNNASGGHAISTPTFQAGAAAVSFTLPASGTYFVWARTVAPDESSNSFFVSMDNGAEDVYDVPVSTSYQYSRVTGRAVGQNPWTFALSGGTHTLKFRGREERTVLDKLIVTSDPKFVPGTPRVDLEAELAVLTSPMAASNDINASGGRAISAPSSEAGSAAFNVMAPVSGSYVVWARTIAADEGSNSFYVSVDNAAEDIYDVPVSSSYQYSRVSGRSTAQNPRLFALSAGPHTLTFRGREAHAVLDKLVVTTDLNPSPPVDVGATGPDAGVDAAVDSGSADSGSADSGSVDSGSVDSGSADVIVTPPDAGAGPGKTIPAASPSRADVAAAVALAAPGDTVVVPSGTSTWTGSLSITQGVTLLGTGVGNTVIAGTVRPLILYAPTSSAATHDYPFRVSGFTFDLGGSGQAIFLSSGNSPTLQTKVRIDHNRFYNSSYVGGGVENLGTRGVIDNNTFDTFRSPLRAWGDMASGQFWWDTFPALAYGTSENMYVEDNTFTNFGGYMWTDSDTGGRYAFRYNTITLNQDAYPLLDIHGGRGNLWGAFGAEVYGNQINAAGHNVRLMSHRGGKLLMFFNSTQSPSDYGINVYDNDGCPPAGHYSDQLINNSYYFGNRKDKVGEFAQASITADNCGYIRENASFWQDAASFNGTVGVGCGTAANRPTTCTTGVGYWATSQSCSDLTGLVGAHPSSPVSGTLYKCTSSNTWTAYFTPYTYPHPLRAGN